MKFLSAIVLCLAAATVQASGYLPVHHAPEVAIAHVAQPIYQKSYIPHTVKLGESHHSYPVTEHRFTRTDYETPYGATYAIPAVRTVQVTRPGYTTYINSAVTKQHVTNHQVAGPTIVKPVIAPVVTKALAPVAVAHAPVAHAAVGYGHGLGHGGYDLGHGGLAHDGLAYGHAGLGHGLY